MLLRLIVAAGLLLSPAPLAQGSPPNPANMNDLQLQNGVDTVFTFSDPSSELDWVWRVYPANTLRPCDFTLEVTGLHIGVFDTDFATFVNGKNTCLADMMLSLGIASSTFPGLIEPVFHDPIGMIMSFGPGDPNNITLPDPGCPGPGELAGYDVEVDLTGGLGAGEGIVLTYTGLSSFVFTAFMPPGFSLSASGGTGGNACGLGDYPSPDGHSTDEEAVDILGTGYSRYGGAYLGGLVLAEPPSSVWASYLEFAEPMLSLRMDSGNGLGPTEGMHSVHYDCPPGAGGSIGARLYDWDQIGADGVVMGTLAGPLASCLNFKGGQLGLQPADPLFSLFLGKWSGTVVQTSDTHGPPTGTIFDNGEMTTADLPLPPQLVPVGLGLAIFFQGFTKKPGQPARGSQVTLLQIYG